MDLQFMPDKLKLTHIYFYVAINTHFVEMFQVALIAKKLPLMRPIVFFHSEYQDYYNDIRKCEEAGIEVIVLGRQTVGPTIINLSRVSLRHRYNLFRSSLRHRYNLSRSSLRHRYNLFRARLRPISNLYNLFRVSLRHRYKLFRASLRPIYNLIRENRRPRDNLIRANQRPRYNLFRVGLRHRYKLFTARLGKTLTYSFKKMVLILTAPFFIFNFISKFLFERSDRLVSQMSDLATQIFLNRFVKSVFKEQFRENPNSVLILPEESFYYQTTIALSVAKSSGVMTVIYPFSLFNDQEYYQGFRNNRDYINPVLPKWLYRVFFPHFRYAGPEVELFIPLYYLGLCVMRGALPRLPWQPNTADVDKVLVQSEKSKDYFLSSGVSLEKLRVVGHPTNLEIIEAVKNKFVYLSNRLGHGSFDVNKKILLIALPPNQHSRWSEVDCGFSDYENFFNFLLNEIGKLSTAYNVIVKPHPRLNSSLMAEFNAMGIATTTAEIAPLVAISDVFIAFASATIQHTDLMKNKTINFDLYNYRYSDYDDYDNVKNVYSAAEFKDELSWLMSDASLIVESCSNYERLTPVSFEETFYREIFN